ncbi:MAG: LPP20 family lipoprotein [Nitrospirae bacterium]|nr:LPP20 family lipoprotein [Nitrospirota bacterium]
MKRHNLLVWFVAILVFLSYVQAGMALAAKAPDWIKGSSAFYPQELYLIGVADGDTRDSAEQKAYTKIALIFKAEIAGKTQEWEKYLQTESKGKTKVERQVSIDQLTKVSTDKVLENAKIAETWFDEKANLHYALAVIDRAQATTAIRERITNLDSKAGEQLAEAGKTTDKLEKIKNLRRVIKTLMLREAYNTDLRIVNPKGTGIDPATSIVKVTNELEKLLKEGFNISVEVSGSQAEMVRKSILEGLNREGLSVQGAAAGGAGTGFEEIEEGPKKPDILIKGEVSIWKADIPDPTWKYVRWCADFQVIETKGKKIMGAVARSGKEGHLTVDEAALKAIRAMQPELISDLAKNVASYIFGEAQEIKGTSMAGCPKIEERKEEVRTQPAPEKPAVAPAPPPVMGGQMPPSVLFSADEYLVGCRGTGAGWANAGKMLTLPSAMKGEAEFLVYSGSRKLWSHEFCKIRPASSNDLAIGIRVVFFAGNHREGVYLTPKDLPEARTEGWYYGGVITDLSLIGRGVVYVGEDKVQIDNIFIATRE